MAYDEELAARVRETHPEHTDFTEKAMFGGLAFMVNTHMACGSMGDDLMVRVGKDNHDAALARGAQEMDFTRRPMRGMVVVPQPHAFQWLRPRGVGRAGRDFRPVRATEAGQAIAQIEPSMSRHDRRDRGTAALEVIGCDGLRRSPPSPCPQRRRSATAVSAGPSRGTPTSDGHEGYFGRRMRRHDPLLGVGSDIWFIADLGRSWHEPIPKEPPFTQSRRTRSVTEVPHA